MAIPPEIFKLDLEWEVKDSAGAQRSELMRGNGNFQIDFVLRLKYKSTVSILPENYASSIENALNATMLPANQDEILDVKDMLDDFSRNNYHFSPDQRKTISTFMSSRGTDLARTQVDICLIQLKVNQLLTQMRDLQNKTIRYKDEIEKCKSFLAPVRLLPPEILIEIFSHTVVRDLDRGFPRRRNYPPLSISQVCSAWRKASFMCPDLWSTIWLFCRRDSSVVPERAIELINQWYSRAEGSRLVFSLSHDMFSHIDVRELQDITWALLPFSHRISHLHFQMDDWDRVIPFLSYASASMPALEKLEIFTAHQTSQKFSVKLFKNAPALRDVTLGISSDIMAMPSRFVLPWASLTRLVLELISDCAFYCIITQCSSLVRASFSVDLNLDSDLSYPVQLTDQFVFPHLEALQLQFYGYERAPSIAEITINALSFPAMKNFELSAIESAFVVPTHTVATLLNTYNTTSAMLLTCLVLTNIVVDHYHFATMLGACLALEKLAVESNTRRRDKTLIALLGNTRVSSPPAPSLPNLTSFALVVNDRISDTLPQKLSSLVHKWGSNPARRQPFEALFVYYDDTNGWCEPEGIFQELRELLGPWRTDDQVEAIAESGMILKTQKISTILNEQMPPMENFNLSLELEWFEA
ncbi:hypothetical protein H0H81_001642 [Sphagnurus paluster]|uniref:F-box domain-containing protein n=1 Tax=Sphagnurus paluster TaxID=117069 RepID=A0A9P7KF50_9AGAR|nr:hypothetical protein H0H81_001642 [Sphagnurus paluster]